MAKKKTKRRYTQKSKPAPRVVTTLRVPEQILSLATKKAQSLKMTRSRYIIDLLTQDLKGKKDERGPVSSADSVFG